MSRVTILRKFGLLLSAAQLHRAVILPRVCARARARRRVYISFIGMQKLFANTREPSASINPPALMHMWHFRANTICLRNHTSSLLSLRILGEIREGVYAYVRVLIPALPA